MVSTHPLVTPRILHIQHMFAYVYVAILCLTASKTEIKYNDALRFLHGNSLISGIVQLPQVSHSLRIRLDTCYEYSIVEDVLIDYRSIT